MRKPVSQRLMPLLLILLTLALDRFTKALAVALPDERTLIPGVLRWIYAENTGMAFSLFSGQSWMLGVVSESRLSPDGSSSAAISSADGAEPRRR